MISLGFCKSNGYIGEVFIEPAADLRDSKIELRTEHKTLRSNYLTEIIVLDNAWREALVLIRNYFAEQRK